MAVKADKKYNFDAVIGPNATQAQVYDVSARHVLDDVLAVSSSVAVPHIPHF